MPLLDLKTSKVINLSLKGKEEIEEIMVKFHFDKLFLENNQLNNKVLNCFLVKCLDVDLMLMKMEKDIST
jgi:hypothetical protein